MLWLPIGTFFKFYYFKKTNKKRKIRVNFPQNPLNVLKAYFSSCKKRKFVKIKNNGLNIVRKNGC